MPPPTPRTTASLVGKIIEVEDGFDLTPFIAAANLVTTRVCGASGYTDDGPESQMELIERWLTAHFYTANSQQLSAARAGRVGVSYQHKVDYGLRSSVYGQHAMLLDTDGNLAALENTNEIKRKIKVDLAWMGTENELWPWETSVEE